MRKRILSVILSAVMTLCIFAVPVCAADYVTAIPTPSKVLVDGNQVAFDAYNIGGANYFKLRDLAMALSNTGSKFSVDFNAIANAIILVGGSDYVAIGGELSAGTGESKEALQTTSAVFYNGSPLHLDAYNIDGANYFKLRDVGTALGFNVDWDAVNSTVKIVSTGMSEIPIKTVFGAEPSVLYNAKGVSKDDPIRISAVAATDNTIAPSDIVVADGATVELYSTPDFNLGQVTNDRPAFVAGRVAGAVTNFYAKVISGTEAVYIKIPVSRTVTEDDETNTELTKVGVTTNIVYDGAAGSLAAPMTVTRGNFGDRKGMSLAKDIMAYPQTELTFYTDKTFTKELTGLFYSINADNPECVAYVKAVGGDGLTTTYYVVKIRHNSLNVTA